ncbi:MAG: tetratricopeptide repeat protein [Myxococcota bacterium]|nr:tetratricopeptide repeat protein [Myxococcota bacterium]
MRCCQLVALVLCATTASRAAPAPTPSRADIQRARAHFVQGKTFYEQGNYLLARAEFEESYRLSRRADLLFNLALVSEKLGHYREAADFLMEYLRQRPDAPDRHEVRRGIEELERREAAQRKSLEPPPNVPPAVAPSPPQTPPPAMAPPQPLSRPVLVPVAPPRRPWPVGGIALLGGGLALLGTGVGLGAAAIQTARAVEQRFDPAEHDKGRQLEAAAIALHVIGAAALVVGGGWTGVWLGRRRELRVAMAPQGLGLVGSF